MARSILQRIVSLEPSITATLCALGQHERLVAVSRYCERLLRAIGDPAVLADKPRLTSTWSADVPAIVALNPDLVIASVPYRSEAITALVQANLNVLMLHPQQLQDVYANILLLGRLCDAAERAEALVAEMQRGFATLRPWRPNHARPRVFYEVWPRPLTSAPPWVAELIDLVGGQIVPATWHTRPAEQEVIAADPEIIIVAWPGVEPQHPELIVQRPAWETISAVHNRRVVAVNEILLNAPGPNLLQGARELAAIIQAM